MTLRPGMSCRAEIYTRTASDVLAVPLEAVLSNNSEFADPMAEDAGQHYVYVVRKGQAMKRIVETGLADDQYQQVRTGLSAGEQIVTGPYKQLRYLRNGDAVLSSRAVAQ